MTGMRSLGLAASIIFSAVLWADVSNCACDPSKPASMEARECSLCWEAETQPADAGIFFLKDNNPRKPNRWLALPREHGHGGHHLSELPKEFQTRLWKAAIAKAKELWGEEWGLAYNSYLVRTQCHGHIHIGKLLQGLAPGAYKDVSGPEQIEAPSDAQGIWIHPVGNKLRIHYGEQITETVLLR